MNFSVRMMALSEANIVAVERIKEYHDIEREVRNFLCGIVRWDEMSCAMVPSLAIVLLKAAPIEILDPKLGCKW